MTCPRIERRTSEARFVAFNVRIFCVGQLPRTSNTLRFLSKSWNKSLKLSAFIHALLFASYSPGRFFMSLKHLRFLKKNHIMKSRCFSVPKMFEQTMTRNLFLNFYPQYISLHESIWSSLVAVSRKEPFHLDWRFLWPGSVPKRRLRTFRI